MVVFRTPIDSESVRNEFLPHRVRRRRQAAIEEEGFTTPRSPIDWQAPKKRWVVARMECGPLSTVLGLFQDGRSKRYSDVSDTDEFPRRKSTGRENPCLPKKRASATDSRRGWRFLPDEESHDFHATKTALLGETKLPKGDTWCGSGWNEKKGDHPKKIGSARADDFPAEVCHEEDANSRQSFVVLTGTMPRGQRSCHQSWRIKRLAVAITGFDTCIGMYARGKPGSTTVSRRRTGCTIRSLRLPDYAVESFQGARPGPPYFHFRRARFEASQGDRCQLRQSQLPP